MQQRVGVVLGWRTWRGTVRELRVVELGHETHEEGEWGHYYYVARMKSNFS